MLTIQLIATIVFYSIISATIMATLTATFNIIKHHKQTQETKDHNNACELLTKQRELLEYTPTQRRERVNKLVTNRHQQKRLEQTLNTHLTVKLFKTHNPQTIGLTTPHLLIPTMTYHEAEKETK